MSADSFIDTNVFLYNIDDSDPRKYAIASQEDLLIRVAPVRWSSGRMAGWWLMGFAKVVQDLVDGGGLGDERDDTHRCPADGAGEREGWAMSMAHR
jgi:hypothetical protein